jgi:hypothetical protein
MLANNDGCLGGSRKGPMMRVVAHNPGATLQMMNREGDRQELMLNGINSVTVQHA